jgi:hypothetical protein
LPPPKTTGKPPTALSGGGKAAPRPGVHLKTGAEPTFSREPLGAVEEADGTVAQRPGLHLPPPVVPAGPSIPPGLKPEEDVKLVGKPLMFKPLSVARKPARKNGGQAPAQKAGGQISPAPGAVVPARDGEAPKKKQHVSLFSIPDEPPHASSADGGPYEPMFNGGREGAASAVAGDSAEADDDYSSGDGDAQSPLPAAPAQRRPRPPKTQAQHSLDTIADDLNLTADERRELFGRGTTGPTDANVRVISFNMEREYAHNEALRSSGEQQIYNPIRSIAPGKHSLRQMVNAVQNNQTALEDSFSTGRSNRKEAAGRYGWK